MDFSLKQVFVICTISATIIVLYLQTRIDCERNRTAYPSWQRLHVTHSPTDKGSRCEPTQSIVFAKTHKTASSTLAVILSRYGYERGLSFALPKLKSRSMIGLTPFVPEMLFAPPPSTGFHILNNHVPFNKSGMTEVMRPEAKYITILRHPVTRFYSDVSFFKPQRRFRYTQNITSPDFPLEDFLKRISKATDYQAKILYNGQLFSLGFNTTEILSDYEAVFKAVDKVDIEMDLVLIAEYFDESLVLLKKLMCWNLEDILYMSQKRSRRKYIYSEETRKLLLSWNFADLILYEHFNKSLWQKIDNYGPSFGEDLQHFRRINAKVSKICVELRKGKQRATNNFQLQNDPKILSLNMSKNWTLNCGNINIDEYPYTKRLQNVYLATHTLQPDT